MRKAATFLIGTLVLWAGAMGTLAGDIDGSGDIFAKLRGLSAGKEDFLEPDRAFVLSVKATTGDIVKARWDVADRYYLYRDKFTFAAQGPGVSLGEARIPAGEVKEDPYFGKVEILHGSFEVDVPITRASPDVKEIQLTIGYQGCAEDGICYPPITRTLPVTLMGPAEAAPPVSSGGPDGTVISDTDRYAGLLSGGATFATLATFFGVGLLLAFTPCVFPMVPILSGILVGQGNNVTPLRAFVLSTVYVLAMALTYAVAGVAAGIFGQNLQAWFQKPGVIAGFAAVFVLLALSMFGLYELQLPSRWQSRLSELSQRQRVGTLTGVALMGVLSALIVGPCVAPALAGALVYIGRTGDSVLGGLALFAMALGMGAPLLVLGASAGHLLPRAGAWMRTVRNVFGVLMLGVAIWFLERILPGPLVLTLWALLFIVSAVFLGAFDRLEPVTTGWRRLGKGLGLAACAYGVVLLVGAAAGNDNLWRPLARFNAGGAQDAPPASAVEAPRELRFNPIRGADGLQMALKNAGGKPVVLDFYADWCVECKQLERETFSDESVRRALSGALLLRADVTANDALDQALLKQLGLYGPPAILFYDSSGAERRNYRLQGFVGPGPFMKHLDVALRQCEPSGQLYC
ncbi:MAG: protein-disulfide reductase DsbD [Chromatiales bacterium]